MRQQEKPQSRDDYVLESLRQADPLLRRMAYRYRQDYDDLYQEAAEIVLKSYERAQQTTNPRAYLHRAIRNALLRYIGITGKGPITGRAQRLSDHYQILSLDMPLRTDPDHSLSDLLDDARACRSFETRNFERLYAVLSALPAVSRQVICMHYGLCGYGVHSSHETATALGIAWDTERHRWLRARDLLRQHTELLDLVGSKEKGVPA